MPITETFVKTINKVYVAFGNEKDENLLTVDATTTLMRFSEYFPLVMLLLNIISIWFRLLQLSRVYPPTSKDFNQWIAKLSNFTSSVHWARVAG